MEPETNNDPSTESSKEATHTALRKADTASARHARMGATAGLYTIVVIAILVLVNWLANRYNKPFDTTSNKRYTLSDETAKVLKNLDSDVTVLYFDRPSNFDSARGTLDRYKNFTNKIKVQYVDAQKNPRLAREMGVKYGGTALVEYKGRREEAKSLTEEGITGALLKDTKGVRRVCFVTGGREHDLDSTESNGLSQFKTALERDNYQTQAVPLLEKPDVPKECSVLIAAGPRSDYTKTEVDALKKYVTGGGRALFLVDPPLNFGREHIGENKALADLLTSWGVTLDNNLVLEENPVGQLFGMGPEVPLVRNYESHPIVNGMGKGFTAFQIARSIETKNADKTHVEKLFSTSSSAIATTKLNSNEINPEDASNKKGPFTLGAAGNYDTADPKNPGRFVVVGNSAFVTNGMFGFQANGDLALNAVNWLSSDEDLISIRPKPPEDRRLNVNQRQMSLFMYFDLIAMPLLAILGGVMIYLNRR